MTFIIQYIVLVYVIAQVHVGVTFIIQYIVLVYVIAQVHVGVTFIIQYYSTRKMVPIMGRARS